jgi:hypothetical protein
MNGGRYIVDDKRWWLSRLYQDTWPRCHLNNHCTMSLTWTVCSLTKLTPWYSTISNLNRKRQRAYSYNNFEKMCTYTCEGISAFTFNFYPKTIHYSPPPKKKIPQYAHPYNYDHTNHAITICFSSPNILPLSLLIHISSIMRYCYHFTCTIPTSFLLLLLISIYCTSCPPTPTNLTSVFVRSTTNFYNIFITFTK